MFEKRIAHTLMVLGIYERYNSNISIYLYIYVHKCILCKHTWHCLTLNIANLPWRSISEANRIDAQILHEIYIKYLY